MTMLCCELLLVVLAGAVDSATAPAAQDQGELVRNPGFRAAGDQDLPEHWVLWEPACPEASCTVRGTEDGLRIDAPGRPFAVGGVRQDVADVKGGEAYAVEAVCRVRDLPDVYRALTLRVNWTRAGKPLHPAGMLVRGPSSAGDELKFHDVLSAPEEADGMRLSLEVKWPRGGSVCWRRVSVRPGSPPPARKVKIGTVFFRPRGGTPKKNLEQFCEQVDEAGRLKLDIVCLGEAITMVGTGQNATQCAEPIPGPSTERLGRAARENHLWIVAGLYEREGERVYNTAVLVDRDGRLAGKYRKIHLPREEWQNGVTPGDEYPVFQTDFGTIAIQICYDWFFPELATIFGLRGAEIVFAPTWGNTLPDEDGRVEGESVFRVRARDNGYYLVPSVYDGNSMVIDPMGRILASNEGKTGVFWHEVDLNQRERLRWVGYWRAIGPRDRMPGTYGPLLEDPPKPTY